MKLTIVCSGLAAEAAPDAPVPGVEDALVAVTGVDDTDVPAGTDTLAAADDPVGKDVTLAGAAPCVPEEAAGVKPTDVWAGCVEGAATGAGTAPLAGTASLADIADCNPTWRV
jgi:hypothetical protein